MAGKDERKGKTSAAEDNEPSRICRRKRYIQYGMVSTSEAALL